MLPDKTAQGNVHTPQHHIAGVVAPVGVVYCYDSQRMCRVLQAHAVLPLPRRRGRVILRLGVHLCRWLALIIRVWILPAGASD